MADAPYRKKLIEVALPLPEINDASAYDKMPGIGPHPKGIHHWWARLPLPCARAILFSSVVDDPSTNPQKFPTEDSQREERERLFDIIRRLLGKRLYEQPEVYAEARTEMLKHTDGHLPKILDPFAGGGSIPLESHRLGLEVCAGDLNPIAVLLNKCNLELAPRWRGIVPVNSRDRKTIGGKREWPGCLGLAADIRYYSDVIQHQVSRKIGSFFPKVSLSKESTGQASTVVAWIWARTVASPNPAFQGKRVPLMNSFWLSSKPSAPVWLDYELDNACPNGWRFIIRTDIPSKEQVNRNRLGTRLGKAENYYCILSKGLVTIERKYIQQQSKLPNGLGQTLVAIVAEHKRGKIYLPPNAEHIAAAESTNVMPEIEEARVGFLSGELPDRASITGGVCSAYGLTTWGHLFTSRQLLGLLALSSAVCEVRDIIMSDAKGVGLNDSVAADYATSVLTFLGLALDRCADFNNCLCRWSASNQKPMNLFARQALAIVWDYAEANLLGNAVGAWSTCSHYVADCVAVLDPHINGPGTAVQMDAASISKQIGNVLASTDPPYYDNIGYATLSDFFYVWLRHTLGEYYPSLFATLNVPKSAELTASPGRFDGDRLKAKEHFETGFRKTFTALRENIDTRFPLTVYYAFKQSDEKTDADGDDLSVKENERIDLTTGGETMLEALVSSGFQITGTWPVRASQKWRIVAMGSNALASYIVLACRPRAEHALIATRKEFISVLRQELPVALKNLRQGNIAPVDFAQAAIGPGMGVFSRYSRVIESDGSRMSVRTALGLINQTLDEVLAEQEGEFDGDTRWALSWFEQFGMDEGPFGDAETLSKAKNTAINGLQEADLIVAKGGKVRLVRRDELDAGWTPAGDSRLTVWEVTQHLIHRLDQQGETGAAELIRQLGGVAEVARDLAYRLYSTCERKKWAQEALAYNSLVVAWPELSKLARQAASRANDTRKTQKDLFS